MTSAINLNGLLKTSYPALVLFLTTLAWNTAGQGANLIDFHFPKIDTPSWKLPASLPQSCADDHSDFVMHHSCRSDVKAGKLLDKNERKTTLADPQLLAHEERRILSVTYN